MTAGAGTASQGRDESAARHWNRMPVGSQRSAAEPGTLEYFDDLRAYRYGYETPFIPTFFRFERMRGARVLELGVGNGVDACEMLRHGARYTGIDVTARHLELTRQNARLHGLPEPALVHSGLLDWTPTQQFDFVYSFGVLHHIPEESAYLARLATLLAPGGRLLIGVYSRYSLFNAYLAASWALRAPRGTPLDDWRSQVAELTLPGQAVTIRIRSRREVVQLLRQAGFEPIRYLKHGFTRGHLPVLGRHCRPDGPALAACGRVLGWYHLFECRSRAGA